MQAADAIRLISLAAIWGGSFIFLRVLSPVLGPIITADLRLLIAAMFLLVYFWLTKVSMDWGQNWLQYFVIGVVNSAIPFALYSFAALHISASYSVILNSSSPLFGALFSSFFLDEKITLKKFLGLVTGAAGVVLVTKTGTAQADTLISWAILACLMAALCYGFSAAYVKKYAGHLKPKAIAGASQLMAGLALMPSIPFSPIKGEVNMLVVVNVMGLAILCSAIAYLLYYRLIAEIGPTKTLTVTFLMPIFGIFWGIIFLHETISFSMIAGGLLILVGTSLILGFVD